MRSLLLLLCLLLLSHARGQDNAPQYLDQVKKAGTLLAAKSYREAGLAYSDAFQMLGNKGRPQDRYDAARAWAMAGVPDSAFDCLDRIAQPGRTPGFDVVAKEPDLVPLHPDPRWEKLLALIKKKQPYAMAEGWHPAGSAPKSYHMGVDKDAAKDGGNAATIRSIDSVITGFGTLMQQTDPGKYLGKKMRMTGLVRSKDVTAWAGLWLRVDGVKGQKPLAFDNMADRAIRGTTEWQSYAITLDVPKEATNIAFGALLNGTGQIWFDAIEFAVEGAAAKISDPKTEPVNLGFEK